MSSSPRPGRRVLSLVLLVAVVAVGLLAPCAPAAAARGHGQDHRGMPTAADERHGHGVTQGDGLECCDFDVAAGCAIECAAHAGLLRTPAPPPAVMGIEFALVPGAAPPAGWYPRFEHVP